MDNKLFDSIKEFPSESFTVKLSSISENSTDFGFGYFRKKKLASCYAPGGKIWQKSFSIDKIFSHSEKIEHTLNNFESQLETTLRILGLFYLAYSIIYQHLCLWKLCSPSPSRYAYIYWPFNSLFIPIMVVHEFNLLKAQAHRFQNDNHKFEYQVEMSLQYMQAMKSNRMAWHKKQESRTGNDGESETTAFDTDLWCSLVTQVA